MTISRNHYRLFPIVMVLSILVSLLYFTWRATATSSFDNNYRTTDQITITDDRPTPCPDYSFNNNWYSFFKLATVADTQFISQANLDAGKLSLNNAIRDLKSWGVSVSQQTGGTGFQTVTVYWSETGNANVTFSADGVQLNQQNNSNRLSYFQYAIRGRINGTGSCAPMILNLNLRNTSSITISERQGTGLNTRNVFTGGVFDINYPTGYAGLPIRQTYDPPNTLYPAFSYLIENYTVKANYLYNVPLNEPKTANMRWRFVGKDSSGNYTQVLDTKVLLLYEQYEYQSINQGDFELWADIEPISPTIVTPPDLVFTMVQRLKIDGNITAGNTNENECVNGVCNAPDPYADCDILDIKCNLTNFGIYLKGILITLFVPTPNFINNYFSELSTFFKNKLGILIFPIQFITDLVSEINELANTTKCSYSTGGTFYGASPTIDLCAMQSISPTFWNAFVLFARGSILFGMAFALRRKLITILRGNSEK